MEREKVKELIEGYREDGFHQIDIELKDKKCIQIYETDSIRFDNPYLFISGVGYIFYIRYSVIEGVAI